LVFPACSDAVKQGKTAPRISPFFDIAVLYHPLTEGYDRKAHAACWRKLAVPLIAQARMPAYSGHFYLIIFYSQIH